MNRNTRNFRNPVAHYAQSDSGHLTRGLRNKNPFNIRRSNSKWLGKIPFDKSNDRSFEQFTLLQYGVRAGLYLLTKYVRDYGLGDVTQIVHRWAPAEDGNNEIAYVTAILSDVITSEVKRTKDYLYGMARAMCYVESRYVLTKDVFDRAFACLPAPMCAYWMNLPTEGQTREEVDGL